ncbi:MAG: cytochrome c biogenesis protein CcsA [Myxococcales bacterium]|nr:cytochrome c biogenesis protein CcsA [Myxococcales bacterium]MBP6842644.1 cytochrome c biogenesis protein CcsA [Kofleriaceae bacterium]
MNELPSSPIATVGTIALYLSFVLAAATAATGIVGNARKNPRLVAASVYGLYGFFAMIAITSALLVYAFLTHDFTIKYVAATSDTSMSTSYKITAFWGALDGSLLFWVFVLAAFSTIAVAVNARRHRDMIGFVVGTIMVVQVFFITLLIFNKDPFTTFLTDPPTNGQGLNPLLQNYWMVIHPPSLYIGFVAATIPFAFAIAALASGRLDDLWLGSVRTWSLICFFFLSFGLILGGRWAYEELGWGGYWAWDPVENAGLIPWFTMTAFLHTAVIQEQRGMMKAWNLVLVILTFFFTIFGTFMTRSGVVQSVHAFGKDDQIALEFIVFMLFFLIVGLGLVIYRLPRLRNNGAFESFASRETAFLVNNWILLACAVFVLFVTMLPTITEHLFGERKTIGAAFFNLWMTPLGLVLLFLAGAAPLLAWRKTTGERLIAQFLWPTAAAVVTMGLLGALVPASRALTPVLDDALRLPVPLFTFGLCGFVFGSIIQEYIRGLGARMKQTGSDPFTSLVGLVLIKRRKYGGYVIHLAIAVLFIGFAGKTWDTMVDRTIAKPAVELAAAKQPVDASRFTVRGYTFQYEALEQVADDNKIATYAHVTLSRGKEKLELMHPARNSYRRGTEPTSEVAIHERLSEDVYVVLTGFDTDTKTANFRIYVNPLVNWVWIGFVFLAIGTFICLIPQGLVDLVSGRPKSALGRAADVAGLLLIVGALLAPMVAAARADDEPPLRVAQAGPPAEHADAEVRARGHADDSGWSHRHRPDSATAEKLMKQLVCMCGGCQRETLFDCKCGFAATERKKVLDQLAGFDLTKPGGPEAAEKAVRDAFIREYGGEDVLATPRGKSTWLVPYLAIVGGLVVLGVITASFVKRGRAAAAAAAAAPGVTAADEKYADRLDDELRDNDA